MPKKFKLTDFDSTGDDLGIVQLEITKPGVPDPAEVDSDGLITAIFRVVNQTEQLPFEYIYSFISGIDLGSVELGDTFDSKNIWGADKGTVYAFFDHIQTPLQPVRVPWSYFTRVE